MNIPLIPGFRDPKPRVTPVLVGAHHDKNGKVIELYKLNVKTGQMELHWIDPEYKKIKEKNAN